MFTHLCSLLTKPSVRFSVFEFTFAELMQSYQFLVPTFVLPSLNGAQGEKVADVCRSSRAMISYSISCSTSNPCSPVCIANIQGSTKQVNIAVLERGFVWQSLPQPTKQEMQKNSSAAISLWEGKLSWFKPDKVFKIIMTTGLNYMSANPAVCFDPLLQWAMAWVFQEGRAGKSPQQISNQIHQGPCSLHPIFPLWFEFIVA